MNAQTVNSMALELWQEGISNSHKITLGNGGRQFSSGRRLLLLLVAAELLDDVLVDPRRQAQRERDARRHDEACEVDEDERVRADRGLPFVRGDVRERARRERDRRDRERHGADPERAFGESIPVYK